MPRPAAANSYSCSPPNALHAPPPRPPPTPRAALPAPRPLATPPTHPTPAFITRRHPSQSGYAEYGNPYGYYGNSVAADYFGNSYPSRAELALYRGAYPSSSYLSTRASNRVARYASSTPWELY